MRLFLASAYSNYLGVFVWMTPPMFVAQKVLIPLGQVAFFSFIGAYSGVMPLDFFLLGNAFVTATASCIWVAVAVSEERGAGTLSYLVASPAARLPVFFGRVTFHMAEGMLHVIMSLAWAVVAFGLDLPPSSWGGIALALLTANIACAGAGLLIGGMAYVLLDTIVLGNLVTFSVLLLSGANVPLDLLSEPLVVLGQALPVTRSIAAARLFADGGTVADATPLLLGDLAVGAMYGAVGFALFRWFETQARRKGTLEAM